MHSIIEQHRAEIETACRKYGVTRLEVFGSAARGDDFDSEKSDVDFIAEFQRPGPMDASKQFFGFIVELEDLLKRNVDVIEMEGVSNPYLLKSINEDRALFYEGRAEKIPL